MASYFWMRGAAQNFGRMRGQHQFDVHAVQLVGRGGVWPHHIPRCMALHGDVGQIQKLIEGAGDVDQIVVGKRGQALDQTLPIRRRATPGTLGQRPQHFDAGHEIVAAMVGDHMAEQAAQQAHVVAQRTRQPRQLAAREVQVVRRRHGATIATAAGRFAVVCFRGCTTNPW